MLGEMPVDPPEGYDPVLWRSIPAVRRQLNPDVHEIYTYGQSSADGMACIACKWEVSTLLSKSDAEEAHARYLAEE